MWRARPGIDGDRPLPQIQAPATRLACGYSEISQGHLCNTDMNSGTDKFTNKVCSIREIMIIVS